MTTKKSKSLESIIDRVRRKYIDRITGKTTADVEPNLAKLCNGVREKKITYLSLQRLHSLSSLLMELNKNSVPGDLIEAGCALGGSAIVLAASKGQARKLSIYDTFAMIPPPGPNDGPDVHARYNAISNGEAKGIKGDPYYGYLKDIPDRVKKSFADHGYPVDENKVTLVKGLLEDTLEVNSAISLAHIDVDWYEPVYTCLDRIIPHLSVGGVVILDDYLDWSGCHEAANDYFDAEKRKQFLFSTRYGHLTVRRVRPHTS